MTGSFFLEPPGGVDIAHYLFDELTRVERDHGAEGINLYRGEDGSYCYVWRTAMIDHDMRESYLFDVRTKVASAEPFDETRDFLFVHVGVGLEAPEVEWHNKPIRFDADHEAHLDRHHEGMRWFLSRDEVSMEDYHAQA